MTTSAEIAYHAERLSVFATEPLSRPTRTSVVRQAMAGQVWQTLILSSELGSSQSLRSDRVTYARFDAPHKSMPDPWLLAQWSEDIGWHRPLTALNTAEQIAGGLAVGGDNLGASVNLQSPNSTNSNQTAAIPREHNPLGQARLNQLLAEAAHDIRSPIAVAQQILHALSSRVRDGANLTGVEGELLSQASLRLTQAHQWAEGILLERSLEHGQPVNVRRRFYPQQWRTGIEPLLHSLAAQRHVQLHWNGWDRSLPRLYLDPTHLSRIVLNLVTNALQASPPHSCLKLNVAWLTNITQHLVLTVEDQGSGLPLNLIGQVNASATWPSDSVISQGEGLGLRTAKLLARGLGGTLAAQMTHAGGTEIRLSLPVDNYHSLIRGWLRNYAELAAHEQLSQRQQVSIHAIRFSSSAAASGCADHAQELLTQIDARLQQTAGVNDLAYRVARDRWLWLSITPQSRSSGNGGGDQPLTSATIPTALAEVLGWVQQPGRSQGETTVCRQQQVFQKGNVSLADWSGAYSSQHNLLSLTSELAEKVAELIGDHIPPVDELGAPHMQGISPTRNREPARQTRIDTAQGVSPPIAAVGSRVEASLADTPCDAFSGTLAELSQQWHAHQRQLNRVHTALGSKN